MRSPIYRNLDVPFRVFGLSPFELSALGMTLVGGGELAQDFGIGRVWAIALTGFIAAAFFVFRQSLGELFASRLLRFLRIPSQLTAKLFIDRSMP